MTETEALQHLSATFDELFNVLGRYGSKANLKRAHRSATWHSRSSSVPVPPVEKWQALRCYHQQPLVSHLPDAREVVAIGYWVVQVRSGIWKPAEKAQLVAALEGFAQAYGAWRKVALPS